MINVVTSLLIAFGGFATGGSGTNLILNNTITLNSDYDCGIYSNTLGEVLRYRVRGQINCDFREKKNEQGVPEYFIANIQKIDFSVFTYAPDGSISSTATFSSTPENKVIDFDVFNLSDPSNSFYFLIDNSLNSTRFKTDVTLKMETINGESSAYNSASFETPLLITSDTAVGTLQDVRSDIDLSYMEQQVKYAFENNTGGYASGYDNGYSVGYADGNDQGYNIGYGDGYTAGAAVDQTAFTIFNGILNIGMLPINVFLAMFNFSVLGINLSNFIMSLLTISVTIWVVKTITGGGDDK